MARKKNTEAPVTEEVKTQDPTVTSETPVISNEESEEKSDKFFGSKLYPHFGHFTVKTSLTDMSKSECFLCMSDDPKSIGLKSESDTIYVLL